MAPSAAGSMKLRTRNTGANWLSASSTPPCRSQIDLTTGAPFHPGKCVAPQLDTNRPTIPPTATTTHSKMTQKVTCTSPHNPPHLVHAAPPPPLHHPPPAGNANDETTYNPKCWLNDPTFCFMVGRSMSHSLKILGLGLGASEMEIKRQYRQLGRKYHPDKNDTTVAGLTMTEASDFFKLLNNANEFLKERQ